MLTPQTLDALPDELISLIDELQTEIIKSIANKITKADYLTPSAEWQLYKAAQLRMSTKEITELLAKYTGKSKREIRRLYTEACRQAINEDAKIYRAYGKDASSFTRSVAFSNALIAGIANADGMMQNFTKSMVQSSRKTVTHLMDKAYLKVLSGAFSPQEAIYSAVAELAAKGIQSVTYPSGRTDWADVAIRRAVITGIGQTAGRMQLDLAEEMDCDLVEVTSHMGARPSHAEWQGKVYSISGKSMKYPPLSVTGYGTGAGLKGWNCRHDFYPFFEGISERASFPIDKAENAKEYELSQKQRSMERAIRRSKRGLAALNESINSTDDPELKAKLQSKFDRQSATLKQQEQRMNEFCEANDLLVRNDRVRVVGFGKSVSQRAVHGSKSYLDKMKKSGIIEERPYEIRRSREERKAIIDRGTKEPQPVFSLDTEINKFPSNARNIPKDDDSYHVIAHGTDTYIDFFGEKIDAYTLSNIIRNRDDYEVGKSIKLFSCNTGNTENTGDCFAQLLANELGVVVEAPTDILYVSPDGSFTIGDYNEGIMQKFYPRK